VHLIILRELLENILELDILEKVTVTVTVKHPGKIQAWLIAGRVFALPWILCNTFLGVVLAGFNLMMWGLAFGIVSSVLLAGHFLNGWRDFVKGFDKINGSISKPYTAGSQVLPRGWLSLRTFQITTIVLFVLSFLLLITFASLRIDVLLLYALGMFCAITYTDVAKVHGYGEVWLFLGHGFGTTTFAYSLIRPLDLTGISAGILLGLWAGVVYTIDAWQDVETDFTKKVKNLAYLVFKGNMRISQLWYFLLTASIVTQVGMTLMGWLPYATLLTIFILPLGHITGVWLDYQFDKGVLLALCTMWLYPLLASLGVLLHGYMCI